MDIKGYTCIYININAKGNKKYTYKRNQKDVYVNGYKWIHIDSINELCSLTVLFFFAGHKGPWYQHRLRYHTGFYVLFLMFAWVACIVKRKLA